MPERTLAIIKPDATAARNTGKIIDMIERAGFTIVAMKMLSLDEESAGEFYAEHEGKPFHGGLVEFMSSGSIVVMALEAENAIERWRELMGNTDPTKAAKRTVRRLYGTPGGRVLRNATHGSDSPETARREISFFFSPEEALPS